VSIEQNAGHYDDALRRVATIALLATLAFLSLGAVFESHWQDGKAELDGYRYTVTRYGHARAGTAVMVYVTEPFSEAKRVKEKCRDRGLILASAGDETLQLFPSLSIDARTLDDGLDIIESCVGARRARAA
jgi:4-aminobutyrate aminotransferase-like enzyme